MMALPCAPLAGQVRWRLEYRSMAKPAARLLASGQADPVGVFALLGKVGRVPRVYASRDRETLLRAMQTCAFKRMGLSLAGAPCGASLCVPIIPTACSALSGLRACQTAGWLKPICPCSVVCRHCNFGIDGGILLLGTADPHVRLT